MSIQPKLSPRGFCFLNIFRVEKNSGFLTNSCFGSLHINNGKEPVVEKMLMVLQGTGM